MKRNRLKQGISLLLAACMTALLLPCVLPQAEAAETDYGTTVVYGSDTKGVIMENGDLYLWGRNDCGQIGNGGQYDGFIPGYEWPLQTTPVKVLENVASAELDYITSAAVTKDGDLYTWGNANGVHQLTPQKIMSGVSRVVVSGIYAAITNSGDLYTWGSNLFGQVGNGTGQVRQSGKLQAPESAEAPVKIMENVTDVQISPYSTAALTADGSLYLWGAILYREENFHVPEGAETFVTQQGDGTRTTVITKPVKMMDNVASFVLTTYSVAALTRDGELYLWGGETAETYQPEPRKVMNGVKSLEWINKFSEFGAITEDGYYLCNVDPAVQSQRIFSCGATFINSDQRASLYLTDNGDVYCVKDGEQKDKTKLLSNVVTASWNAALTEDGQMYLLDGDTHLESVYTKSLSGIAWLGSGCAIAADGDFHSWGNNMCGTVGNGSAGGVVYDPVRIFSGVDLPADALKLKAEEPAEETQKPENKPLSPATVRKLPVSTFFANGHNSAAILENGDLYVWGRNDMGQVGNGGQADSVSPPLSDGSKLPVQATPVKVLSNVALATQGANVTAAILENGDLYVWGANYAGQVGNGGTGDKTFTNLDGLQYMQTTPVKVLSNVAYVDAAGDMLIAITGNRDLYAWGATGNFREEGTVDVPVKVLSNVAYADVISRTGAFCAAITVSGELYVWGSITDLSWDNLLPANAQHAYFVNGDGRKYDDLVKPVKIMDNVADISLNRDSIGVISRDGVLKKLTADGQLKEIARDVAKACLGRDGALSLYLTTDGIVYARPQRSEGWTKVMSDAADIGSGGAILDKKGNLYTVDAQSASPQRIFENVAAFLDNYTSAVLTNDGELHLWDGSNQYGVVGNGTTEPQEKFFLALENVALPGSTSISLPKAWYQEAMDYVNSNSLTKNIPTDQFSYDRKLSRAMLAQMLYCLEGEPVVSGGVFSDIPAGAWYADGVNWAAREKVVNGIDGNTYGPENPITRQDMAVILYRYAQNKDYDVAARADLSAFPDRYAVSAYAVEAMQWAVAEGLIKGTAASNGSTILSPKGNTSCAEMATILMRFVESNQ